MGKHQAVALLLSGLFIAASADAQDRKLVSGLSSQASNANEKALERVLDNPSSREVRVVKVDAGSVAADTRRLELDLLGQRVTASLVKAERTASGHLIWAGSL